MNVYGTLLGLRLRLLVNLFRRSPWQVLGVVLGLFYGLGLAFFVASGLAALRLADVETARSVVVVFGTLLAAGGLVVPLLFGVDDAMDPRRFSLFGISTSRLATALALAALISVPALAVAVIAFAQVVTWSRGPELLLALIVAPLILAGWTLGSRVTTSIAAFLLSSRRARDASAVVAVVGLIALSPAVALLFNVDWLQDGFEILAGIAEVASWTPLGAAWAVPADAAAGLLGPALLKLIVAAAWVLVLWMAWRTLVAVMLVTPVRQARAPQYTGLGWFGAVGATPVGAIAARSLTYWGRDMRYQISLVVVPIVPIVMAIPLAIAGVPLQTIALIPVPIVALFMAWSIHNDVAYDHTAVWLHVASNTRGWADRLGRSVPVLLVGVPLVAIAAVICAALYGDWMVLPAMLGVGYCVLFAGIGLSSIMSARFPYPAVRPGDSPFAQPQSGSTAAALIQGLSFFATILVSLPVIGLASLSLFSPGWWEWAAFAVGVPFGLLLLVVGVWGGGLIFERRAPELLAFALRN